MYRSFLRVEECIGEGGVDEFKKKRKDKKGITDAQWRRQDRHEPTYKIKRERQEKNTEEITVTQIHTKLQGWQSTPEEYRGGKHTEQSGRVKVEDPGTEECRTSV